MIETIYSRDNSEEMSKPEVNIRLPKNIKQIGQGSGNMNSQIYIEENVPITYNMTAHGTASSEVMAVLGLENDEKRALISLIPGSIADKLMRKLRDRLFLGAPNTGIAFNVPLSGCSSSMMQMMKKLNENHGISLEVEEDESMDNEFVMLMAFVDEGYSEEVMAAARPAGAKGGTVFHSRVAGREDTLKIWNIVVQQQREIVIILAGCPDGK